MVYDMVKNENYMLKEIAGSYVLLPFGTGAIDFNGVIKLNETAKFLWEKSIGDFSEDDLVEALLKNYEVDESTARKSVLNFINELKNVGCINE